MFSRSSSSSIRARVSRSFSAASCRSFSSFSCCLSCSSNCSSKFSLPCSTLDCMAASLFMSSSCFCCSSACACFALASSALRSCISRSYLPFSRSSFIFCSCSFFSFFSTAASTSSLACVTSEACNSARTCASISTRTFSFTACILASDTSSTSTSFSTTFFLRGAGAPPGPGMYSPPLSMAAFRRAISSWNSRSMASLGSSLILGLFLMFLARFAYRSVLMVSSKL
mmetsp:Transcript_5587/g.10538  ORF Transcript_5587/g.10538 Transcript_5587/m.10538 type:complete len:227 (+) Transcript_5587:1127-1807(+)